MQKRQADRRHTAERPQGTEYRIPGRGKTPGRRAGRGRRQDRVVTLLEKLDEAFIDGRDPRERALIINRTHVVPALKLGTLLFPYGPTPAKVTGIAGECLSMWDSCKVREQAFRFIRYMCYEKNLAWCKDYFIVPVRKADLNDPYYKSELMAPVVETLSTHVYLKWMYDLGNTFPHANELAAPLTAGLNDAYLLKKSPKQAMDEVAEAHNAILAQYKDELQQFLKEQG